MKKLLIILLMLLISSVAMAQQVGWQKPVLGTMLRTDGHWSVQGLIGAWGMLEGSGSKVFDLIGPNHATFQNELYWDAGGLSGDGTDDYASLDWTKLGLSDWGFTFAYKAVHVSGEFSNAMVIFDSGTNEEILYISTIDSNVARALVIASGTNGIIDGSTNINDGAPHMIVGTFSAVNERSLWVDGKFEGSDTTDVQFFNFSDVDNFEFFHFDRQSAFTYDAKKFEVAYIWQRILTADQIRSLAREPYQMFARPSAGRHAAFAAAAAAPSGVPTQMIGPIISQLMKNPISAMFAAGLVTQIPRLFSNKPMTRRELFTGKKN